MEESIMFLAGLAMVFYAFRFGAKETNGVDQIMLCVGGSLMFVAFLLWTLR